MSAVRVRSEYSAQPLIARPNPALLTGLNYLKTHTHLGSSWGRLSVVDQGCGKLRHLKILRGLSGKLTLVDTHFQITRSQRLFNQETTILDYITHLRSGPHVTVMCDSDFESASIRAHLVVSVAVFDVVTPLIRKRLTKSAARNLRSRGYYLLVIPRNDQSITKRCCEKNRYADGFVFVRTGGLQTFYSNFNETSVLVRRLRRYGFELIENLSNRRQVCLILQKEEGI
jgi:hypothetical protein